MSKEVDQEMPQSFIKAMPPAQVVSFLQAVTHPLVGSEH